MKLVNAYLIKASCAFLLVMHADLSLSAGAAASYDAAKVSSVANAAGKAMDAAKAAANTAAADAAAKAGLAAKTAAAKAHAAAKAATPASPVTTTKAVAPAGHAPLLESLRKHHTYDEQELTRFMSILKSSSEITQGHPSSTNHPISREACLEKAAAKNLYRNEEFASICQDNYMAPLYDPAKGKASAAKVCVDQFEFPDVPCEYPLVWVKASEAQTICQSLGKRLCDAQEWEDSCAGRDRPLDYVFSDASTPAGAAHKRQRHELNNRREKVWAYGPQQNHKLCATGSAKSPGCDAALVSGKGVYQACGSNTYPAGAYPECKSKLDVYDQHGNAAEHMNLPLTAAQMTKNGGTGHVEMKGSWFVFQKISAHEDDCHWRAPYWHGTTLMHPKSHNNYHLGFRCCKDVPAKK